MRENIEEYFCGCLTGLAVGDAIGFELQYDNTHGGRIAPGGVQARDIREFKFGKPFNLGSGQYTDDTQMALALARCMAEEGEVDGEALATAIADLWRMEQIIGPSRTCTMCALSFLDGKQWDEAAMPAGEDSNCAAKRAAPVGLFDFDRPEQLVADAVTSARITHLDPRAQAGAAVMAWMTARIVREGPPSADEAASGLGAALAGIEGNGFAPFLERLAGWMAMEERDAIREIARAGRDQIFHASYLTPNVLPSVLGALYANLRAQWDFCEALAIVYRAGGDMDSTGAMTGALAGAACGYEAIPEGLRSKIKDRQKIKSIATALFEAATRER